MIEKVDKTFYEITGRKLTNVSQLHLFSILKESNIKEEFFNVFKAYSINESANKVLLYNTYEVDNDDWWDNISYKMYRTSFLWWVIALSNKIINPFEELNAGDIIYVLKEKFLYQLLKEIKNIGNE